MEIIGDIMALSLKKWSMAQEKSKTLTVVYAQEIPYYTHITT